MTAASSVLRRRRRGGGGERGEGESGIAADLSPIRSLGCRSQTSTSPSIRRFQEHVSARLEDAFMTIKAETAMPLVIIATVVAVEVSVGGGEDGSIVSEHSP